MPKTRSSLARAPSTQRRALNAKGEPIPKATADQTENVPAYQTLAAHLKSAILAGQFANGRQLPTESELTVEFGLSRQTVRKAFDQLVADSLVYRVRGRGTFATPFTSEGPYLRSMGSIDELLNLSVDTEMEVVRAPHRCANVEAAARLLLNSDEVTEFVFRRLHHEDPFLVTTVSLPPSIARAIEIEKHLIQGSRSRATIIGLIEAVPSIHPIAGAHQSLTAVRATDELAELLDCDAGDPVLRIDRLYFDVSGQRLEFAITHANPVRFSYRLELRRDMA